MSPGRLSSSGSHCFSLLRGAGLHSRPRSFQKSGRRNTGGLLIEGTVAFLCGHVLERGSRVDFKQRGALGFPSLPFRPSPISLRSKFEITGSPVVRLVLWGLLSLLGGCWRGLWRGVRAVVLVKQLERIDRVLVRRRQGPVAWG